MLVLTKDAPQLLIYIPSEGAKGMVVGQRCQRNGGGETVPRSGYGERCRYGKKDKKKAMRESSQMR